jgi:L-asparaginase
MRATVPKVALIGTGGTIGSTGFHSLDLVEYLGPMLSIQELLAKVPECFEVADIVTVEHSVISSDAIGISDWLSLTRLIETTAREHADLAGIVVTHGTATMEETAYFLNLALNVDIPVVIVGAQRPITGLSSDASMNLFSAMRVAASEAVRGLGVLVVMNEQIHAARDVTKRAVFRLDAFESPSFGVLGHTDLDAIHIYRTPVRKHTTETEFSVGERQSLPRVDIVSSYADADGAAVEAFVAAGARGLVVSALAPGAAPPKQNGALLKAIDAGVAVVYTTRAGAGRTLKLAESQARGSITADNLNAQKARVLLMLALIEDADAARLQRIFDTY